MDCILSEFSCIHRSCNGGGVAVAKAAALVISQSITLDGEDGRFVFVFAFVFDSDVVDESSKSEESSATSEEHDTSMHMLLLVLVSKDFFLEFQKSGPHFDFVAASGIARVLFLVVRAGDCGGVMGDGAYLISIPLW
jgi:hypothetical protein